MGATTGAGAMTMGATTSAAAGAGATPGVAAAGVCPAIHARLVRRRALAQAAADALGRALGALPRAAGR